MPNTNVLLIGDEEAFVTTLAERMELRGFDARIALNGQAGLDMIKAEIPDIVVLDLRMPGLSGTDVLREIEKHWPDLPVIILSGHGSKDELEACLGLGACAYHSKPLDIDELLNSIRAMLSQS